MPEVNKANFRTADADPRRRWLLAYEPTDKELAATFKAVPSAEVRVTPKRKVWRKAFYG